MWKKNNFGILRKPQQTKIFIKNVGGIIRFKNNNFITAIMKTQIKKGISNEYQGENQSKLLVSIF